MENWWQITADWKVENSPTGGVGLPANGFVKGGTLVMLEAGDGANLFWADGNQSPCSLHVPNLSITSETPIQVTFAGQNFSCLISSFRLPPPDSPLTVTLNVKPGELGSGNTGTFVAQAVAGPSPHSKPGHERPRD
jgi:hypothetical protein